MLAGVPARARTYASFARLRPNLSKTLVNFATKYVPGFPFTSIQVNKNYLSALHVDKCALCSMSIGVACSCDCGRNARPGAVTHGG
eukprot:COSAG01_NODE_2322_length_7910_cov_16.209960_7_plen_86_part_00